MEDPDERSIDKSVRFLRRTYMFQASEFPRLGSFITLSGVRRLGRRVVCEKKTNLSTVEAVDGRSARRNQGERTSSMSVCRRRVPSFCEVWHKTIKSVSDAKGFRGTPLTAPVTA